MLGNVMNVADSFCGGSDLIGCCGFEPELMKWLVKERKPD